MLDGRLVERAKPVASYNVPVSRTTAVICAFHGLQARSLRLARPQLLSADVHTVIELVDVAIVMIDNRMGSVERELVPLLSCGGRARYLAGLGLGDVLVYENATSYICLFLRVHHRDAQDGLTPDQLHRLLHLDHVLLLLELIGGEAGKAPTGTLSRPTRRRQAIGVLSEELFSRLAFDNHAKVGAKRYIVH